MAAVIGIVLAAGAGSRMGRPKALVRTADGQPWLARATGLLRRAGCDPVVVVLGAKAEEARALVPSEVEVAIAEDWAVGMSASLKTGLAAARASNALAALITLVDLPGLPLAAAQRVLVSGCDGSTLRQAMYNGAPGHPVLIGRDHWTSVAASVSGDAGARRYLVANGVEELECGDLFDGHDLDGHDLDGDNFDGDDLDGHDLAVPR